MVRVLLRAVLDPFIYYLLGAFLKFVYIVTHVVLSASLVSFVGHYVDDLVAACPGPDQAVSRVLVHLAEYAEDNQIVNSVLHKIRIVLGLWFVMHNIYILSRSI